MAKAAKQTNAPAVTLASLGLENYEVVEVHRSELKNADYNPRILPDDAKKKLRAQIKKNGMVGTPTWNMRSGNIVGGHQRISILDSLAGTSNYTLKVARIDVDDKKERELNVALNNDEAMGVWDMGKLGELLRAPDIDLESTGFDPAGVMRIFGDTMVAKADDTRFDELALQLDNMRETFKKIDNRAAVSDFYFLAVFKDGEARDEFLRANGLPVDRYQNGNHLGMLIRGETIPAPPQPAAKSKGATVPDTAPAE